jgi:hypothetical protein
MVAGMTAGRDTSMTLPVELRDQPIHESVRDCGDVGAEPGEATMRDRA